MKLGVQPVSVTYLDYATSFNLTITNTGATVGEVVAASDLFFSEYIEGSSSNKAIEIYNGTGFTVDLSTYKVKLYSNGATTANSTLSLTGSLSDGDVFVIYNSSASSAITAVGDLSSGVANFNGDDVVTLENNTLVIDTIGDIPQSSVFASDVTLVRNGNIAAGNLTYTPSEWSSYAIDTFTYLGQHTTNWIASGISAEEQAFAYGQYFIDVTGPYCETGMSLDIPWSTLKQEYLAMVGDAKDAFFVSTDPIIVDARARYTLIIDRYSGFSGDNFMVDSEGTPLITYTKNPVTSSSHENFMFVLIIVLALTSLGGYYVYRHKKSEL